VGLYACGFWFLGGFFIANFAFGRALARPTNFSWVTKNDKTAIVGKRNITIS
jgi:hypothetical protein